MQHNFSLNSKWQLNGHGALYKYQNQIWSTVESGLGSTNWNAAPLIIGPVQ